MTVKELINKLLEYQMNSDVYIYVYGEYKILLDEDFKTDNNDLIIKT